MEFTSTSTEMVTVRVSGEVVFTNDKGMKKKILANNPNLVSIYQSADNPIFEVFYIEHGEASIADFSGQPPKKFKF